MMDRVLSGEEKTTIHAVKSECLRNLTQLTAVES